jgi:glutathione S-transferase
LIEIGSRPIVMRELSFDRPGIDRIEDEGADAMTTTRVSAFRWVPPFAQGLVRDLRVRWALEEANHPYEERLIGSEDQGSAAYRALQPFGQVPAYEEDGLTLFESGAIVWHVAERSAALLPSDANGRARARTWMFAALNSVEPHLQNLTELDLFHAGAAWAVERRPMLLERATRRLADLEKSLDNNEYLVEDRFTVADLLMTTVLRIPRHTDLVAQFSTLDAYRIRCESRPAFRKALADQLATFARNAPQQDRNTG